MNWYHLRKKVRSVNPCGRFCLCNAVRDSQSVSSSKAVGFNLDEFRLESEVVSPSEFSYKPLDVQGMQEIAQSTEIVQTTIGSKSSGDNN